MNTLHEMIDTKTEDLLPTDPTAASDMLRDPSKAASFRWGVVLVLLVIIVIAYLGNRGYIVAALVNGKPIFGWDVNQALMSRYGQQTLTTMINEELITDAAKKQGVVISQNDINTKESGLMKSLGPGVKIDDVLKYQGMSRADFDDQVRLQLIVEKVLGKDVTVSDSEISDYISKNKDTLTASDEAGMNAEAKRAIFSQKINDKVQTWFGALKAQAKIVTILK